MMWARKRLDIGWHDLHCGLTYCLSRFDAGVTARRIESSWPDAGTLACLSVRSGLDLLLQALRLPAGSEVLVSALTIPDMVRIIEAHGLVAVPVDLDLATLGPSESALKRAWSPRSRAVLIAHLFGSRQPLDSLIEFARERELLVIEDCAQAFVGSEFRGTPDADVSLFSFGTIKTATALGGAVLRVRDPGLHAEIAAMQGAWPRQPRAEFFRKLIKVLHLKGWSGRWTYRLLMAECRLLGIDFDRLMNRAVRGFAGPKFFERIRRQPCAPLLALLERRLNQDQTSRIAERIRLGQTLMRNLHPQFPVPGAAARIHTFWVFPIFANHPAVTIRYLRDAGFDATQGESMIAVPAPVTRPETAPRFAQEALQKLVYLPCYPDFPQREAERMAIVLQRAFLDGSVS